MKRLQLLQNHLSSKTESTIETEDPKKLLAKYRSKSTITPTEFKKIVFGEYESIRNRVFAVLASDPMFKQQVVTESTRKEIRAMSFRWIKFFFDKFGGVCYEEYLKNPAIFSWIANSLHEFDPSLSVKVGVHFNLYTKTIINMGTEKHKPYINRACSLEDIGCFGLTELGHGSNARGILTRATYDIKTREFIINTPSDFAMKFWIGAAAHLANMCIVMAQLYIGDKSYGVHGFLVPIRNKKDHTLLPGVLAGDCGLKAGLNAIDNGFLIFKNVRIPYDNLLDRFSSISPEGKFKSPIKSADKRFGLSLGSLSGGRIQLSDTPNSSLKNALTIAIRFAACRRQFGAPGKQETNILEYPLTQYRLMPYLAEVIVVVTANSTIVKLWNANQDKIFQENNPLLTEVHSLSSVIKPIGTWLTQRGIQECREVCGGLGYSGYNRLGQLREDSDINTTWEGDNNVLLQQTAKFLLDNLRKLKSGEKLPYASLSFLQEEFDVQEQFRVIDGKSAFARDEFNLKKALEVRANFLIHASFEQLKKNMMNSETPLEAWNSSHVFYLKDAAIAYGETFLFNEFGVILNNCPEERTRLVFRKVSDLYGYYKLEQHSANLLEIGYITRDDLLFIRDKVKELCSMLKDEAVGIIDALALPDELLNSPIGAFDGDIYNRFIKTVWSAPGAFEKAPYWKDIKGRGPQSEEIPETTSSFGSVLASVPVETQKSTEEGSEPTKQY